MWAAAALWLLAAGGQAALLGRQLHCVLLLADLETDIQNPHDWARQMNRFRTSEYLGQALLAAALLSSRCWASGLANLALAAFVLERLRRRGEDRCAPADAFGAGSSVHRRNRLALLGCHAFLFALLGFRLVECAAREAMRRHPGGPEGARLLAGELLRAAAASTHGY